MRIDRCVIALLILGFLMFCHSVNAQTDQKSEDVNACGLSKEIRDPLIDEAEKDEFSIRRVEIAGNTYTRHREFVKKMVRTNEGDIFMRSNLERTVKGISKIRSIYPITMDDIEVRLDRTQKTIDIVFCVKQRPRS